MDIYPFMTLLMITYFITKHFIIDFPMTFQPPWMFLNKGIYGHPGGLAHAGLHALASLPILLLADSTMDWSPGAVWHGLNELQLIVVLLAFEFLVHYHMDYFKVRIGRRFKWAQYTDHGLWIKSHNWFLLLGVDQLVHYLTYVVMVGVWIS